MIVLSVAAIQPDLDALCEELGKLFPKEIIHAEQDAEAALLYASSLAERGDRIDYAFVDTDLSHGKMNGIELVHTLRKQFPRVRTVFLSDSKELAADAFSARAIGYLLKPIKEGEIVSILDDMIPDWRCAAQNATAVRMQAFGDFEVFVGGKPLEFERQKAKELLAYLVDRHGAGVSTERISSILFPDDNYDRKLKNRVTAVISSLRNTLKSAGIEDILVKSWNQLAIDTSKFSCDAYDYEKLDPLAFNLYRGEYMFGYEWAEYSTGTYDDIKKKYTKE